MTNTAYEKTTWNIEVDSNQPAYIKYFANKIQHGGHKEHKSKAKLSGVKTKKTEEINI
jgi:hypothetical protein